MTIVAHVDDRTALSDGDTNAVVMGVTSTEGTDSATSAAVVLRTPALGIVSADPDVLVDRGDLVPLNITVDHLPSSTAGAFNITFLDYLLTSAPSGFDAYTFSSLFLNTAPLNSVALYDADNTAVLVELAELSLSDELDIRYTVRIDNAVSADAVITSELSAFYFSHPAPQFGPARRYEVLVADVIHLR